MALHRWMYRGGHPNRVAKILNAASAWFHSLGLFPNYFVTLQVIGRKSGRTFSFPLAMTVLEGKRYLVSMLGNANWVQNVRAAGGKATLVHGMTEQVHLQEVEVGKRPPILKAYLRVAPGARPHMRLSPDAPVSEFERIAAQYPVFQVERLE